MAVHVVVSDFGCSVGKKSERLLVRQKGEVLQEVPLFDVEQVTIESAGVSISSDLIRECMERGIMINFLTTQGEPFAKLSSPNLVGTVATRRAQLLAYNDERGVELIRAIIEGKLKNQAVLLKYFAKYRKGVAAQTYERLAASAAQVTELTKELRSYKGSCIDEVRGQFLSVEGRAANVYWQAVQCLLAPHLAFEGREHRGASDPVNSLLNYGYGILYHQVWGAVTLAGLDPFAGFLHVDRPGKPSLTLDLVEEFRQQVVDRVVLVMVNQGVAVEIDAEGLTLETRREIARRVLERLDSQGKYAGKNYRLRNIIQLQARRVATFLRGEGDYKPYVATW